MPTSDEMAYMSPEDRENLSPEEKAEVETEALLNELDDLLPDMRAAAKQSPEALLSYGQILATLLVARQLGVVEESLRHIG